MKKASFPKEATIIGAKSDRSVEGLMMAWVLTMMMIMSMAMYIMRHQ